MKILHFNNQIKAARQLGLYFLACLVAWFPYFIIFMVIAFFPSCITTDRMVISIWLSYSNSAINPILYAVTTLHTKNILKDYLIYVVKIKKQLMLVMNLTQIK